MTDKTTDHSEGIPEGVGVPYRYRFTLEGLSTLDQYMQAAMDAGFYGVDNHPHWPCYTENPDVWAAYVGA